MTTSRHHQTRLGAVILGTLLAGMVLLAYGYWGAWVPHPAAGLTLIGLDMPEYVKFLPEVTSGQINVRREVFFLPLITFTTSLILLATMQTLHLPRWFRLLILLIAVPATLAMLPPAWTPALLRMAEFRLQVIAIGLLLAMVLLSPLLHRYFSDWLRGGIFICLGAWSLQTLTDFRAILPAIERLYHESLTPGLAFYLVGLGCLLILTGGLTLLIALWRERRLGDENRQAIA